jgi:hypothetical protein
MTDYPAQIGVPPPDESPEDSAHLSVKEPTQGPEAAPEVIDASANASISMTDEVKDADTEKLEARDRERAKLEARLKEVEDSEPVQAGDESDEDYAGRVRSWRGRKSAAQRALNQLGD